MSEKSQTIGDFTVSRPSQIIPAPIVWDGRRQIGKTGSLFYFPDASQISAMVGDHYRQTSAIVLARYQSSKLLGSSPSLTNKNGICHRRLAVFRHMKTRLKFIANLVFVIGRNRQLYQCHSFRLTYVGGLHSPPLIIQSKHVFVSLLKHLKTKSQLLEISRGRG